MNFKSLSLLSMLGIAAGFLIATFIPPMAAHADPVATASTATDAAWQLVAQYGWLWGGMLLLLGLGQALLRANESKHWIAQGRTLALLSGGLAVLGSIAQWHFGNGPLEGVLVTLVTALTLVWHPTVPAVPAPAAKALRSGTAAMLAVLLLGGLAVSQTGCAASARESTIKAALITVDASKEAYVVYDGHAQTEIVAKATSLDDGKAKLEAYRASREKLVKALTVAYQAIAVAAQLNDDPSVAGVQKAVGDVLAILKTLTGGSK